MEDPKIEIDLTNSQFELLVSFVNSIQSQRIRLLFGEIEFDNIIRIKWEASGVHLEMKANSG